MTESIITPVGFTPMMMNPVAYIWVNRSTNSDVMSTAVTTRISEETFGKSIVSKRLSSAALEHKTSVTFRVRNKRRTHELIQERDRFMAGLKKQREAREALEHWAATKLQRGFRDFMLRPRAVHRRTEPQDMTKESLKEHLLRMAEETQRYVAFHEHRRNSGEDETIAQWKEKSRHRSLRRQQKRHLRAIERMATLLFQTLVRGYLVRKAMRAIRTRHHLQRQQQACLVLQCAWRVHSAHRHRAQRKASVFGGACVRIQRLVRGALGRAEADRRFAERRMRSQRHEAATRIQALARRRQAGQRVTLVRAEVASTKVQGLYRRHLGKVVRRRHRAQREQSAVVIQSTYRGKQSRVLRVQLRRQRTSAVQHASAAKIQARARGQRARAEVQQLRRRREEGQEGAATRIQSQARARIAKKRVQARRVARAQEQSATKIQSAYRQCVAKQEAAVRRGKRQSSAKDKSARKIQSVVRGKRGRRKYIKVQTEKQLERAEVASRKIQAQQRRRKTAATADSKRLELKNKLQKDFFRMQKSQRRVVRRRSRSIDR